MKILIIGGVAGGASAATRARRVNANCEITIIERGPAISFANCGLPYHLGGEIKERKKLLVATPELFKNRFNIDVLTNTEALEINTESKSLVVKDLVNNKTNTLNYDKLIISTGSKLRRLPIFEKTYKNVFSLWTLKDLDKSLEYIKENTPKNAIVIGAGFVGLEVAEQLKHLGLKVSLIEKAPQVLGPLDPEMASFISDELKSNEIDLYLGREIINLSGDQNINSVTLDNSEKIDTDLILWGIGVTPESDLARSANLELSNSGAIIVNENQQTSNPDIYAVGDVSEYLYAPLNRKMNIPLAGPANKAGRIAGEHAASNQNQVKLSVNGTSIVRVFKKAAGATGLTEKLCKSKNIPYSVSYISANHHAGYFPGAKELIIKVLFSPTDGKILGGQVVGEEGVDKRLDILSTLIHFGGKASDLANLDLAYAPPFGSAKDALHMSAFTILNHLASHPVLIHPSSDLKEYQVIDVRTASEREKLPLNDSLHIPIDNNQNDLKERLSILDKTKKIAVICHSGKRAHIVASLLVSLGFKDVVNVSGGMMMRSRFV